MSKPENFANPHPDSNIPPNLIADSSNDSPRLLPDLSVEQKLQKAMGECERLRIENAAFRESQELDERGQPEAGRGHDQSSSVRTAIHNQSTTYEKVNLFRSCF